MPRRSDSCCRHTRSCGFRFLVSAGGQRRSQRLEHLPELFTLVSSEQGDDFVFDVRHDRVGMLKGVTAGAGQVQFLNVRVSRVVPTLNESALDKSSNEGCDGLGRHVQPARQRSPSQAGLRIDRHEEGVMRGSHPDRSELAVLQVLNGEFGTTQGPDDAVAGIALGSRQ